MVFIPQMQNMLYFAPKGLVSPELPLRECVCQKFLQPSPSLEIQPPPFLQGLTKPHYFSNMSFHEQAGLFLPFSKKSCSLKLETEE